VDDGQAEPGHHAADPALSGRDAVAAAISEGRVIWKRHAVRRMAERGITQAQVLSVLISGAWIEEYPNDQPYPSALVLGYADNRPLHVVVGLDAAGRRAIVITAYEPDLGHFEGDYRTRRKA
jgi:hypothetical protein